LTAVPCLPTLQVAPPLSVPVSPWPEASAAVVPAPSSKAYAAARPPDPPPVLLATVTDTAADVAELPAASRARALRLCEPLVVPVVSQAIE
jgi:hypothetical protein